MWSKNKLERNLETNRRRTLEEGLMNQAVTKRSRGSPELEGPDLAYVSGAGVVLYFSSWLLLSFLFKIYF